MQTTLATDNYAADQPSQPNGWSTNKQLGRMLLLASADTVDVSLSPSKACHLSGGGYIYIH